MRRWTGTGRWRPWAAGAAALALVTAGALVVLDDGATRRLTADFTRVVGIYPGSDVRVLGVRVGEVVRVVPRGGTVRVEMSYAADYDIPADARAVIVPPSVVSDRYVQLTPAYS
ncbi:MAG TPA: MlaD family protein, partial [Micromonospora sp.]